MNAIKIHVRGIVQGVGFRPFVYRIATRYGLKGFVKNLGDAGVEIVVEGETYAINSFLKALENESPPLADIHDLDIVKIPPQGFEDFVIEQSEKGSGAGKSVIPPDVSICDNCIRELFDPTNPRYMYPFIVCTDCGPRFSIIADLPYDRENTTMAEFEMCDFCRSEYEDPHNRRYHAEPVCCEKCGPRYTLYDGDGVAMSNDPIKKAAQLIDEGYIVAIKGVGGIHLACDATNDLAVKRLRKLLKRPQQPFAVMVRDINTVQSIAYLSEDESEELQSYRKPIVLLRKKKSALSKYVAPGLHTVGIMLPYAGVHLLLFHYSKTYAYVMTSANMPGLPMIIDNETALSELKDIADFFLLHNRKILNRVDDSVVRFVDNKRAVIRRSRGFVPLPMPFPSNSRYLAVGAELMNSFSITKQGFIYPSQYIGNTTHIETVEFMKSALKHFQRLMKLDRFDAVVSDLHPNYNTTKFAEEFEGEVIKVQHHFAHIAGVMLERRISEAIGIAMDGVGYGLDGAVWGGEILALGEGLAKRLAHIDYFPLPGGDLSAYYPIRSLIGLLSRYKSEDEIMDFIKKNVDDYTHSLPRGQSELEIAIMQAVRGLNAPLSSSTGRVLDAVAALTVAAFERTYEGEPAMKLESLAIGARESPIFDIPVKDGRIEFYSILDELAELPPHKAALSAHLSLAESFSNLAIETADALSIKNVVLNGGVAYNEIISSHIRKKVESAGLNFYVSSEIPRGDNGLSVGQAYLLALYHSGSVKIKDIGEVVK